MCRLTDPVTPRQVTGEIQHLRGKELEWGGCGRRGWEEFVARMTQRSATLQHEQLRSLEAGERASGVTPLLSRRPFNFRHQRETVRLHRTDSGATTQLELSAVFIVWLAVNIVRF